MEVTLWSTGVVFVNKQRYLYYNEKIKTILSIRKN